MLYFFVLFTLYFSYFYYNLSFLFCISDFISFLFASVFKSDHKNLPLLPLPFFYEPKPTPTCCASSLMPNKAAAPVEVSLWILCTPPEMIMPVRPVRILLLIHPCKLQFFLQNNPVTYLQINYHTFLAPFSHFLYS